MSFMSSGDLTVLTIYTKKVVAVQSFDSQHKGHIHEPARLPLWSLLGIDGPRQLFVQGYLVGDSLNGQVIT